MAKYGPASAFLLVGGVNLTSSDAFGLEENPEAILTESHGIGDDMVEHLPVGLARVTLAIDKGLYDDRDYGPLAALEEMGSTRQLVSWGFRGDTVGKTAVMIDGVYVMKWSRTPAREDLLMAGGEITTSGHYYRGKILHGLGSEAGDGDTEATPVDQADSATAVAISTSETNDDIDCGSNLHGLTAGDHVLIENHSGSTPDINGDQVVNTVVNTTIFQIGVDITIAGTGGTVKKTSTDTFIADLHVPALFLDDATNVIVTLLDSDDDITYAAVTSGAFTAVTLPNAYERLSVTGQIRRYRALDWAFTGGVGAPTATPYVVLYSTDD